MMTGQSGSPLWFARVQQGRCFSLQPHSLAGWLVTGLYAVAVTGVSLLLVARGEPVMAEWISWAAITTAMTVAFLLVAWRTSAAVPGGAICAARPAGGRHGRSLLIASLGAAAIIGAALLGVEF